MLPERAKEAQRQSLPERVVKKLGRNVLAELEDHEEFDKGQLQTLALVCKGKDKCPYGTDCPVSKPPVSERCPMEIYYQEKWFAEYCESYNIDPVDKSQASLVVSLISVEIQLMRQQSIIAKEGFEQMVVTESEDGRKKYDKKLHNVLQLIDQLEKRKATIIKEIRNSVSTKQTNQIVGDIAQILSMSKKSGE